MPSKRTTAARLGILAAGSALAALTATGPAAALDAADKHPPVYKGRVTAKSGLLLRETPTRGGRVVRHVPHGKVVTIFCKTKGGHVGRTNHWYLLTDGTWAWGSAHYIANIGKAPRWC
ncbi:SH3 domain-containing protein [Streptomyces sp. WAC 01529]|uniref:SH3 domain-containing protein n=1 Tax=Streptomyces sp. WAC 01529 TaxID=2203205 RepID=UPI000F6BCF8A|nr:SH3 domain-containing protein [Streptomyces sp. WAC 01529]AZM55510.1 SH3 domain-containing protein [Streptomyces sp. WAC 01529]